MSSVGKCIVVCAPSGSGKTTLVRHLLTQVPTLEFSISACTRPPRKSELEGHDYYFITTDEFQSKIAANAFVEWEQVYPGRYYGTLQSEVERIWQKGHQVIFDVDVEGGLSLKKAFGNQCLSIFIQPPSLAALENRLRGRKSESRSSIRERLEKAELELAYAAKFDQVILNDKLELALEKAIYAVKEFIER